MTIGNFLLKNIVRNLITGNTNYRHDVLALIDSSFLQYTVDFFKRIAEAKIENEKLDLDWYKKHFVDNPDLSSADRAINAGLNMKSVQNMYGSSKAEILIGAANDNYEMLLSTINKLIDYDDSLDISLSIKFNKISVDLSLSESLLVINALAVKRAALRGGIWSTAGKRVELPLMIALCKLYAVPEENYELMPSGKSYRKLEINRQIDFYLNTEGSSFYKCEVKLMGKGNPESADVTYARGTKVFIADTLSRKNITQFNNERVEYIHLNEKDGYKRFGLVLQHLDIPHVLFSGELKTRLDHILDEIILN